MMLNMSLQNDSNLRNIEDSLSCALKSKNDLIQEVTQLIIKIYLKKAQFKIKFKIVDRKR